MVSQSYPPALESATREQTLPSLDGLRAVAILLVVFYHSGLPVNGGLGVLMFFVLSGFLITWLLLNEEKRWGNISLKLFYVRRSLRIVPAFYVFWFLVVGTGAIWANGSLPARLCHPFSTSRTIIRFFLGIRIQLSVTPGAWPLRNSSTYCGRWHSSCCATPAGACTP